MRIFNRRAFTLLIILSAFPASGDELPETMSPPPPRPKAIAKPEAKADSGVSRSEQQCRAELRKLGVEFKSLPAIRSGGCRVSSPLEVSSLGGGVDVRPAATLSCPIALAAARYIRDTVRPAVRRELGNDLVAINQASGYVCRPRNGTKKLSEHAFGNAFDLSALVLKDGTTYEIRAYGKTRPNHARLLKYLREKACGPFKTVLGPGSDADHADHLHFDLAERRNGGTYCK